MHTPRGSSWIQTFTGRRIDPFCPRAEDVDLLDIAHALAHTCRFTGHTRRFYSVAEHSAHVALMVGALAIPRASPEAMQAALLHDAAEAYLCDVARPVKRHPSMAPYRATEHTLQHAIEVRFGIVADDATRALIREIDGRMLHSESVALINGDLDAWKLDRFGAPIEGLAFGMSPIRARGSFLTIAAACNLPGAVEALAEIVQHEEEETPC